MKNLTLVILFFFLLGCTSKYEKNPNKSDKPSEKEIDKSFENERKKIYENSKDIQRFNKIYSTFKDTKAKISYGGVDDFGNITSIHLRGNIPIDSFLTFKYVKTLWIFNNNLSYLDTINLKKLHKLKNILIYNCELSNKITIMNHISLEAITISNIKNKIDNIYFDSPISIKRLYLDKVEIKKITLITKKMINLRRLSVINDVNDYINFNNLPKNLETIELKDTPFNREMVKTEQKKRPDITVSFFGEDYYLK